MMLRLVRTMLLWAVIGLLFADAHAAIKTATYNVGIANRMCRFALVAYCIGQGGHGVPEWDCPACTKYYPGLTNVTVVKSSYLDYDTHAFVVYDPLYFDTPSIVISFSGTDPLSIAEWLDDLDATKIEYPLATNDTCSDCYVHKGFYDTYAAVRTEIWNAVMQYKSAFGSNVPVQITGHSLGAALAAHCALDGILTYKQEAIFTYTFGQPRVGNEKFAKFYQQKISQHLRVTHHRDPVPHLPTEDMGFYHMVLEVFYPQSPNSTYQICNGSGEDSACSDQYDLDYDILNHLDYLGYDFTGNFVECKV